MDYKGEIQYVRYYSPDSAARSLERRSQRRARKAEAKAVARPVHRPALQIRSYFLIGTVVAAVMVCFVFAGLVRIHQVEQQKTALRQQIQLLEAENLELEQAYAEGYDLEEIRTAAEAMGLVPQEQVRHIKVTIQEPVELPEPSFWQAFWQNIRELFA